jgi:hypothetical protein
VHKPYDKDYVPGEQGDYAVMVGEEVLMGRLSYGPDGEHLFRELGADGEWKWDHHGGKIEDHTYEPVDYVGPWARFPDGTFPEFPKPEKDEDDE